MGRGQQIFVLARSGRTWKNKGGLEIRRRGEIRSLKATVRKLRGSNE